MLASVLFFISISSISALVAYKWGLDYEYGLPIAVAGIIIIQFIFGLIGALNAGFWIVVIIILLLWIYTLYKVCREKEWKQMRHSFFSKGFFLFLIVYMILNITLTGMVVHSSDEFSHWGRVVKAMVWLDDLGTNSNSRLTFFSYPPGVALFQYYFEKIYIYCTGKAFSEWHLYLAHTTLWLTFIIPLMARVNQMKRDSKGQFFLLSSIFILLPMIFYPDFYYSLYVDGMIGVLAGCGLCWVILYKGTYDFVYLFSLVSVLTLVKSTSFVFVFGICMVFVVLEIWRKNKKGFKYGVDLLLTSVVLKIAWQIKINMSDMEPPLSAKIDVATFINVLSGNDTSYRSIVWENFKKVIFDIKLAHFDLYIVGRVISISYIWVLTVGGAITIILLYRLKQQDRRLFRNVLGVVITGYILFAIFNIGLLFTYLFKFSEAQSITLHSYARYNNTMYLLMYMIIFFAGMLLQTEKRKNFISIIIAGIIILTFSFQNLGQLLSREAVSSMAEWRGNFTELADVINEEVDIEEKTYFICQDNRSWYNSNSDIQVAFQIYPRNIQYGNSYFTNLEPGIDSEWFYNNMTVYEFREELIKNYDYVAIHRQDEYFTGHFRELFEDQESIEDDCLYKIDSVTGLLRKVQ